MIVKESIESRELGLYADNESDIYFSYIVPVVKNLAKYYKRGTFDKVKAIDAFFPAATAAAVWTMPSLWQGFSSRTAPSCRSATSRGGYGI